MPDKHSAIPYSYVQLKVSPVIQKDKPRQQAKQQEEQSFLSILKRQANKDIPTFILTRLAGVLIIANIVAQTGKWRGWWS